MYIAPVSERRVRKPPTGNVPSLQNYFQTNCRSFIPMLLKNIRTMLGQFVLTQFMRTWDMILHSELTELHFFVTISAIFFRLTTFVVFRLALFVIRRQSSKGALWRSCFRWTSTKIPVQECIFAIVASLELCWKCAVLQMFF